MTRRAAWEKVEKIDRELIEVFGDRLSLVPHSHLFLKSYMCLCTPHSLWFISAQEAQLFHPKETCRRKFRLLFISLKGGFDVVAGGPVLAHDLTINLKIRQHSVPCICPHEI